jgi:hypothetical protein
MEKIDNYAKYEKKNLSFPIFFKKSHCNAVEENFLVTKKYIPIESNKIRWCIKSKISLQVNASLNKQNFT